MKFVSVQSLMGRPIRILFFCAMSLSIAGAALADTTPDASEEAESCQFAPSNTMRIPAGTKSLRGSGIEEGVYNSLIDRVENYYKPIVKTLGKNLVINRMWKTDVVNSTAHRFFSQWYVDAFGGLARYPIMTADAELAVLCHEMGHHLGGFPKMPGLFVIFPSWASNEGQADYFATSKCFRLLNENEDNTAALVGATIPVEVKNGCENSFHSQKEIALCEREALAGNVLAQILYELGHSYRGGSEPDVSPSFSTPSKDVIRQTTDSHPISQCRLDTYFNGSLCTASATENFGKKDPVTGACAQEKGDQFGYRPVCWYKPNL